jgi:hypothetical protein
MTREISPYIEMTREISPYIEMTREISLYGEMTRLYYLTSKNPIFSKSLSSLACPDARMDLEGTRDRIFFSLIHPTCMVLGFHTFLKANDIAIDNN